MPRSYITTLGAIALFFFAAIAIGCGEVDHENKGDDDIVEQDQIHDEKCNSNQFAICAPPRGTSKFDPSLEHRLRTPETSNAIPSIFGARIFRTYSFGRRAKTSRRGKSLSIQELK